VGVNGPEGEDDGGAWGQVEVKEEAVEELVKEGRGVGDGVGPGLDGLEADFVGLDVIFQGASALDGVVEGGEAEVKAFGFGATDEVVFGGGEAGEAGESLLRGFGGRGGS
jgi:hypothetical protein